MAAGAAFGLAASAAALLAGPEISLAFDNEGGHVTWLTLFAGVFGVGTLVWWLMVSRPKRHSPGRGAIAGVFVALLSYPAVLFLAEFLQRDWQANAQIGTFPERVAYALLLTGLALFTTGFATMLLLSAVGALLGRFLPRIQAEPAATEPPARGRAATFLGRASFAVGILAVVVVALFSGLFLWLSLLPVRARNFTPDPSEVSDVATHEDALAAFRRIEAREAVVPLHPRCSSTLLTHGQKAEWAVVFFHGLTSCPAQADILAQQLFAMGYNVYVPRLPRHGEADRLTLSLAGLTAEELAGSAEESVGLGRGLGEEVLVVGLSAGGTMASWLAQSSGQTDGAILVAPFFSPRVVPPWAVQAATNLLLLLPNQMIWWDASDTEGNPAMDYAYPRFATHALAQVMRLGLIVDANASAERPVVRALGVLLNEADESISNRAVERVIAAWRKHGGEVDLELVPLSHRLPHDLIDPRQEEADIEFVYPVLIEMISRLNN